MKTSNLVYNLPEQASGKLSKLIGDLALANDQSEGYLSDWNDQINQSTILNPWFTRTNVVQSLEGIAHMIRREALQSWLKMYDTGGKSEPKRVGMVLAGNIPLVGFHDIFSVALSGHHAVVKCASQDRVLLPALFKILLEETHFEGFNIEWIDGRMPQIDAMIATGSNNTSRYFEYYFSKVPHIIRKNRNAVAILSGNESEAELIALGADIFSYFGMGCRNVSKLYIHSDFEIDRFFKPIYPYHPIINHHKYANNYDYYRALWMLNREDLLDNGFLILRPSEAIASPIASLFYERYTDETVLRDTLKGRTEEIQCIVSQTDIPFGKAQAPELWDYADGVDTMAFLQGLG